MFRYLQYRWYDFLFLKKRKTTFGCTDVALNIFQIICNNEESSHIPLPIICF